MTDAVTLEFAVENDRIMRKLDSDDGFQIARDGDKVVIQMGLDSDSGTVSCGAHVTLTMREAVAVAWFIVAMADPDYDRKLALLKRIKSNEKRE